MLNYRTYLEHGFTDEICKSPLFSIPALRLCSYRHKPQGPTQERYEIWVLNIAPQEYAYFNSHEDACKYMVISNHPALGHIMCFRNDPLYSELPA